MRLCNKQQVSAVHLVPMCVGCAMYVPCLNVDGSLPYLQACVCSQRFFVGLHA